VASLRPLATAGGVHTIAPTSAATADLLAGVPPETLVWLQGLRIEPTLAQECAQRLEELTNNFTQSTAWPIFAELRALFKAVFAASAPSDSSGRHTMRHDARFLRRTVHEQFGQVTRMLGFLERSFARGELGRHCEPFFGPLINLGGRPLGQKAPLSADVTTAAGVQKADEASLSASVLTPAPKAAEQPSSGTAELESSILAQLALILAGLKSIQG
jgi:hypothetical protein